MTNPSNAAEKPSTGCGCGDIWPCPEALRLRGAWLDAHRHCADAKVAWLRAQKEATIAQAWYRAHVEASNG